MTMGTYPWTTKRTAGGTFLYCTKHKVACYGGVCSQCVPDKRLGLECSRGPDAAPNAAKRYAGSAMYPGEEAGPLTGQPLQQLKEDE